MQGALHPLGRAAVLCLEGAMGPACRLDPARLLQLSDLVWREARSSDPLPAARALLVVLAQLRAAGATAAVAGLTEAALPLVAPLRARAGADGRVETGQRRFGRFLGARERPAPAAAAGRSLLALRAQGGG